MGDYWWLLLIGAGMWAVIIAVIVFGKKTPENPDACPKCGHEAGLDGNHCGDEISDFGGWRQNDPCRCVSNYHWRYESTVT